MADKHTPAFPVHPEVRSDEAHAGMTLRDWFAGQALAGFVAQPMWGADAANSLNRSETGMAHTLAKFSYDLADAMLAERSKP